MRAVLTSLPARRDHTPGCARWTGTGVSYFTRCGSASFVFSLKCKSKGVHDSLLSALDRAMNEGLT